MNSHVGYLRKLKTEVGQPIQYFLPFEKKAFSLNECVGHPIQLVFTGNIYCIQCGRKTRKSFQQGFCFPCLTRLQECNLCVIYPERCRVEQGCPKDDWAHAQCHQSHIVYLANSSGLKVGITRESSPHTRWIDQGAITGLPLFKVMNRYQAGVLEMALKTYVNDRTAWRKMLMNDVEDIDLHIEGDRLLKKAEREILQVMNRFPEGNVSLVHKKSDTVRLHYPVQHYPLKITPLSLDKTPHIQGVLLGIKGQYLLLDNGVFNVRKFGGYEVEWIC